MNKANLPVIGLVAVIVLGGLIRFGAITDRPLWFDESDTWRSSYNLPYEQFLRWNNHFETAPLSFLTVRLSTHLFGTDAPWAMRLPAFLFGTLCIPAMFLLGRLAYSNTLGLLAATLLAFDPNMVDQSQQCRMYALMVLLTLVVLIWSIHLLRKPDQGFHGVVWHWVGLGLTFGLLLCTLQFSVAVWVGVAVGTLGLLAAGRLTKQPHSEEWKVLSGLTMAYVIGLALANVGVFLLFERVFGGGSGEGDGANMTALATTREIVVAAKDLVGMGFLGLLVYPAALVGIVHLWMRCKTSTAILVGVAVMSVLILYPFRKIHHFLDQRYLILAQPAIFVGLGLFALGWRAKPMRIAAIVVVLGYAGLQAWQCIHIDQWWQQPDKYLIAPEIMAVHDERYGDEAIVYHPQVLEALGRYYDLPPHAGLDEGLYENYRLRPDPYVSPTFDAPATWLIIGMVNWDGRLPKARTTINTLARHYGVAVDQGQLAHHLRRDRVVVARFSHQGITWRSAGAGD